MGVGEGASGSIQRGTMHTGIWPPVQTEPVPYSFQGVGVVAALKY